MSFHVTTKGSAIGERPGTKLAFVSIVHEEQPPLLLLLLLVLVLLLTLSLLLLLVVVVVVVSHTRVFLEEFGT